MRAIVHFHLYLVFLLLLPRPTPVAAANSGDEVVVVYNTRSEESESVAKYYARKRGVPSDQVFGFSLTTEPSMSRTEFRAALQRPLAKKLADRKLWKMDRVSEGADVGLWRPVQSRIRYLVLCYEVPFRILPDPNLKEEGVETWRTELRRNEAAVDSELALLPLIEQNPIVAGPMNNPLFQTTNSWRLHPTNGLLMVTRLDGPSAEIARGLVDKALAAEQDGLWGRAYFDIRNTTQTNYMPGDLTIRRASEICRRLGFETITDTNGGTFPASFPMSQIGIYIGWYDETVSGPFTQPGVEFFPGAFAYHLHSFSAASLRSTNRNWVGPLLARGAAVSIGAVDEPYLGGTPDIATFIGRFLHENFTFGEAAYAAQGVLSWQNTVVGDPLYRPTKRNLDQLHQDLLRRKSDWAQWSYLRLTNLNLANGRSPADGASYLELLDLRPQSAVLTEKLASLYDQLGKPSSALHSYEAALKLGPSPVQRLRLRLTVGEKLMAAERYEEAYDNYRQLLAEMPQYSDRPEIEKKIETLATQIGKGK